MPGIGGIVDTIPSEVDKDVDKDECHTGWHSVMRIVDSGIVWVWSSGRELLESGGVAVWEVGEGCDGVHWDECPFRSSWRDGGGGTTL